MPSGLPLREAVALAAVWWQDQARHLLRNPELVDPDLGIESGITRGLPRDHLSGAERRRVVQAWDAHHGPSAAARAGLGVGPRGLAVRP